VKELDRPRLARVRVCFGHQSVGQSLVNALAATPDLGVDVVETTDHEAFQRPVFAHFRVGRNGDPWSKCLAFAEMMKRGVGDLVDIAFFKFCYVDITSTTDVERVFQIYEETMASLARSYPTVAFLHVTVPLRRVRGGRMGWWRERTGWTGRERADQRQRHVFNTRLRAAYAQTGRTFDLAAIEATSLDGTPCCFVHRGEPIPTLVPEYTHDGGHLTQPAAARAAAQLISRLNTVAACRAVRSGQAMSQH